MEAPVNRFKHRSYQNLLKDVHLPAAHNAKAGNDDVQFNSALNHQRQLCLTSAFNSFANKVQPISISVPLLILNAEDIVNHWAEAVHTAEDESLKALLHLFPILLDDLRSTLLFAYDSLLETLLFALTPQTSTAALTALLSSLAAIFKHLLVPQNEVSVVQSTWVKLSGSLPRLHSEVQRAMAEVWAAALRRMKSPVRNHAILSVITSPLEDVAAWTLVFSCKSVSQTLHSSTSSFIRPLIEYHIRQGNKPSYVLVRRVLTALNHHVRNAEGYEPISSLVVTILSAEIQSSSELDRIFQILHIPLAVRQGGRMTPSHLEILLLTTLSMIQQPNPALTQIDRIGFIQYLAALLTSPLAANMTTSIMKVFETSFSQDFGRQDEVIGMKLTETIAQLNFPHFKTLLLPIFLRYVVKNIQNPSCISLLASLARLGKIPLADSGETSLWRPRVEEHLLHLLEMPGTTQVSIQGVDLDDVFILLPFCRSHDQDNTSIEDLLKKRIEDVLQSGNSQDTNQAKILGSCFSALRRFHPSGSSINVPSSKKRTTHSRAGSSLGSILDLEARLQKEKSIPPEKQSNAFDELGSWILRVVDNWTWSETVISGLAELCLSLNNGSLGDHESLSFERIYTDGLKNQLLSHQRTVRLSALRIINFVLSLPFNQSDSRLKVMVKRCVAGEEVSLDVAGVRERVLRIGRVVQVVPSSNNEDNAEYSAGLDISSRWLISQLKIPLRPLWSPASGALSSLASSSVKNGEAIWALLWAQLQGAVHSMAGVSEEQDDMEEVKDAELNHEDDRDADTGDYEEEKTWRDPVAHKLRVAVRAKLHETTQAAVSQDRLDAKAFEAQLISTLSDAHSLAEKHNRDIIPFFFSLCDLSQPSRLPLTRPRLLAYLTLLSKFTNPKVLHSTAALKSLYINLLSQADRSIQSMALSCYLTYFPSSSELRTKEELILRGILDDVRFRETLTQVEIAECGDEMVDVLMRLSVGLMLKDSNKKAAVLGLFAGIPKESQLEVLVRLMLRFIPATNETDLLLHADSQWEIRDVQCSSEKQQVGYINLLGDVLYHLGPRLVPYWPILLGTVIDLVARAHGTIEQSKASHESDDAMVVDHPPLHNSQVSIKALRSIRQLGLKRIAQFMKLSTPKEIFDFKPFLRPAFPSFISPRLSSLAKENTQAPSALLDLAYAFTAQVEYIHYLVVFDDSLLPNTYACLVAKNVKPSVVSRIFDLTEKILAYSLEDEDVKKKVLLPHISILLSHMTTSFQASLTHTSIHEQRQIEILSQIAPYASDANQATMLTLLFLPILLKGPKQVTEKIKGDILKTLNGLIPNVPDLSDSNSTTFVRVYQCLSKLFSSLRSRASRIELNDVFTRLADRSGDATLIEVAEVLQSLNAYSEKRLDEPDFGRRLDGFGILNSSKDFGAKLSTEHWRPLLYNMFHAIQNPTEMAIRNNAASVLKEFTALVASHDVGSPFNNLFTRVFYPSLKNGLHSRNELVRTDLLSVLSVAVQQCQNVEVLHEMHPLLAHGDEEANFFNNIYHLQNHRRSRALRRLGEYALTAPLRRSTVSDIFIPLISHFIVSSSAVDHHLVTDAIQCMGRLAGKLHWGSYHALVQDYLKLIRAKDESERIFVRTLVSILDNFPFNIGDQAEGTGRSVLEDSGDVDEQETRQQMIIADAINSNLLPTLLKHLETHDENTDDTARIPLATGIVTIVKQLPSTSGEIQVKRLLTIMSQILRSRSQETRDLVRDSLYRITLSLGPQYLPHVLSELRRALIRGPHLHVLAYTIHFFLVHLTEAKNSPPFSNFDGCVDDITHVSSEVIFGESGKDVQAEGFKTKIREVKASSSKGLDCFAIASQHISSTSLRPLLLPLRSIMHETESAQLMRIVDEVLKRIAGGLNSNQILSSTDILSFCHTLIVGNAEFLKDAVGPSQSKPLEDAMVQTKRNNPLFVDHFASNSFRFVVLGLDLLSTGLRRNRFDTKNQDILARLQTLLVDVGNALYSSNASIITLALKCSANLSKCPLPNLERPLTVIINETISIIKKTGSTESDVVQTAFKSLAVILRDGPPVEVKEKDIVYLLEILTPDLEEPSRQAAVFGLLRAIIARKFVVPEIYDLMQTVCSVLVTSQSIHVQELCRGVLLQFLLDYPQGKGRLRNQITFLVKNLSYAYESGRISVLEIMSALVTKLQLSFVEEYHEVLFVGLVLVMTNDDSSRCREMAAAIVKNLFSRLGPKGRTAILGHCKSWATQQSQPQLTRVSFQIYGLVIDVVKDPILVGDMTTIVHDIGGALEASSDQLLSLEQSDSMDVDVPWEVPYHALTALFKLLSAHQEGLHHIHWDHVTSHLLYPHAWVRTSSCRLIGLYFSSFGPLSPFAEPEDNSPRSLKGMLSIATKLCLQLKSEHLDDILGLQIVKNLFHLGKCFTLVSSSHYQDDNTDVEDDDGQQESHENPLAWLFSKLSYQLKSAHIMRTSQSSVNASWDIQTLSIIRWFAAMSKHLDSERLKNFLVHILTPIHRFTEDETIRDDKIGNIKTVCLELQNLIQEKVGVTSFADTYNQVRRGMLDIQRARKVKRAIQATTNPEAAAKRKVQRNSLKKESRKRKGRLLAEDNGRVKRKKGSG